MTFWTPNMSEAVVKVLCHRGPVRAVAFDSGGTYMATTGADARMKIWDLRTYKPIQDYFTTSPGASVDISQRGLLSVGFRSHVQVWKDALATKASAPYLRHELPGSEVETVRFRPFEDVLGVGHSDGFHACLVPGAGEPNYDSLEADPFKSKRAARETEVAALLDKVRPIRWMIGWTVG